MEVAETSGGMAAMGSFTHHVLRSRLFMAFASLLILSMAGASYLFGIYSGEIKSSLGYDQTTLNLLSFFKDLGGNLAVISGLINEVAPVWFVLSLGILFNFFGYFMMWLAVSGRIAKPKLWQMCFYLCAGANSQSFANTGATVTCVKNFPAGRGIVLGHLKGAIGLSGAVITQLYHAFYGEDPRSLILLIAWFPVAVTSVFLRTIRIMSPVPQEKKDLKFFHNLLFLSLGLAGFLMVIIILQQKLSFSKFGYATSATIVLLLVFSPIVLVVRGEYKVWRSKEKDPPIEAETKPQQGSSTSPREKKGRPIEAEIKIQQGSSTGHNGTKNNSDSCFKNVFRPPGRGEDHTILQALFSVDMLVLFTATTFGVGGTLTAIDNLGQIGKALGYPSSSIATFVSLVSIWNYLGRVSSGFASEIFLAKHGVAGHLYDKEALRQMAAKGLARKPGEDLSCLGVECYKPAFLIITAATFVGCLVSLVLVMRTREFYRVQSLDVAKKGERIVKLEEVLLCEGYYPLDVAKFYDKGTTKGSVLISKVNGQYVEIIESNIRMEFNLPESHLTADTHAFNLRDFWNSIRGGEGTSEEHKLTRIKKTILKRNFEILVDILYKCVDCRIGALDDVSNEKIGVLHVIMEKIKYNWAKYGLLVSHLLKREGINLRKRKATNQSDEPSAEKQHLKEMAKTMRKSREEMEDMLYEEETIEIHEEKNDAGADQEAFVEGEVVDT
nr:uncharacterized membrane protein YMR155W-like [Ipomoea batatas]